MHGRRGVLELEEGAIKVNVTLDARACINEYRVLVCEYMGLDQRS